MNSSPTLTVSPTVYQSLWQPPLHNQHSKIKAKQKEDQERHTRRSTPGQITTKVLLCPGAQNTIRRLLDFRKQLAKTVSCIFFHDPSPTTSRTPPLWEEVAKSQGGSALGMRQLWRCPGDWDSLPPQGCGMAHGTTVKLQTWLLSKTQSRDLPGGTLVKNLPASAGDTGSSPGPGRSHMPRSN